MRDPSPYSPFPSEGRHSFSSIPFDSDPLLPSSSRRPAFPSFPSDHRPLRSSSADTRQLYREEQEYPRLQLRQGRELTPPFQPRQPLYAPPPTSSYQRNIYREITPPSREDSLYQRDFNRILREKTPPSSTALLDLIQRYPSAKNSVFSRSTWSDGTTSDGPGLSASTYSDFPSLSSSYSSRIPDQYSPYFPEGSLSNSLTDPYGTTNSTSSDFTPSEESPRLSGEVIDSQWSEHTDPYSSTSTLRPLDVSVLDDLVFGDDEMSRSTSEWKNSFERAQQHFRTRPYDTPDQPVFHGFTTNGISSLDSTLKRSNSSSAVDNSLLGDAVRKLEQPAEEFTYRPMSSTGLSNFWNNSLLAARASSPTPPPRISTTLTAAERLSMLKESPDGGVPSAPKRTDSIASRQRPFMSESHSTPNFSALDRAVAELSTRGGCGRFPTEENAFSPPFIKVSTGAFRNGLHSPSPDSSEASSYGVPTGLPHPKPKHNVVEQIARATGSVRLNFPSTGSVSSRIVELEKRPGTPTLRLAGGSYDAPPPLSPRSTVFRTKPVIHVDVGRGPTLLSPNSNDEPTTHFSFSLPYQNATVSPTRPLNGTPLNGHSGVTPLLDRLRLDSPFIPNAASTPKAGLARPYDEYSHESVKRLVLDNSSSSSGDSSSDTSTVVRAAKGVHDSSIVEDDCSLGSAPMDISPRWLPRPKQTTILQQRIVNVPKFHFPQGKPVSKTDIDASLRRAGEVFRSLPNSIATYEDMPDIVRAFGLPVYWKRPIWEQVSRGRSRVEQKDFSAWWWNLTTVAHDEAARFVHVLSHGSSSCLIEEDFHSLVLDLIHTHPGLEFYRKSEEFHERYIQVIITRIFWTVNRSWSGKITAPELRKSNLLENIRSLEKTDDINSMTDFFSYEHFYVVYCKFWEIDTDHDMLVSKEDFSQHNGGAIVPLVMERIFSGAVTRGKGRGGSKRDLGAFTAFLLADEDKAHPTSIEYWFRILDLDGDGKISLDEMETFYKQTVAALAQLGIDTMSFNDLSCNLIDMLEPQSRTFFTLKDLKRSPLAYRFFNSFVNWRKFYQQETCEGEKASIKGNGEEEVSDWVRFCIEEYENMMENDENDDNVDDAYSLTLED